VVGVTIDWKGNAATGFGVEVEHTNSALGKMPILRPNSACTEVMAISKRNVDAFITCTKESTPRAKDSEVFPDFPIESVTRTRCRAAMETDQTTLVGGFAIRSRRRTNRQNSQRDIKTCPMVVELGYESIDVGLVASSTCHQFNYPAFPKPLVCEHLSSSHRVHSRTSVGCRLKFPSAGGMRPTNTDHSVYISLPPWLARFPDHAHLLAIILAVRNFLLRAQPMKPT